MQTRNFGAAIVLTVFGTLVLILLLTAKPQPTFAQTIPTRTPTPSAPTNTPVPPPTNTPIPQQPTNTPVPQPTNTPVPLPTNTPTPFPTNTFTPVPPTATPTGTFTPVPATNTPIPPTATWTPTPRPTNTSVPQATNTPVPLPTNTPVQSNDGGVTPGPTDTPVPPADATDSSAPAVTAPALPDVPADPVSGPSNSGSQCDLFTLGRVTGAAGTRVRSGPSTDYGILSSLSVDDTRPIVGYYGFGQWWHIEYAENQFGWVSNEVVTAIGNTDILPEIDAPALNGVVPTPGTPWSPPRVDLAAECACAATTIYQADTLQVNVRSGPGADYTAERQLSLYSLRKVVGRYGYADWWLIENWDGTLGWVSDSVGNITGYSELVPQIEAPTLNGAVPTPGPAWIPAYQSECAITPTPTSEPTATVTPIPEATANADSAESGTDDASAATAETVVEPTSTFVVSSASESVTGATATFVAQNGDGSEPTPTLEPLDLPTPTPLPELSSESGGSGSNILLLGGLGLLGASGILFFATRNRDDEEDA